MADDASVQYALHHGHVHLAACFVVAVGGNAARTRQQQEALQLCNEALQRWEHTMLVPRHALAVSPHHYALSSHAATAAFAHWLLLVSHTAQRKWPLIKKLLNLDKAFGEKATAMGRLWHEVARLFGSQLSHLQRRKRLCRTFFSACQSQDRSLHRQPPRRCQRSPALHRLV